MKSSSSFKMSKDVKRLLCTLIDNHQRGEYKRAMIQAQLDANRVFKSTKPNKESSGE